jgi:hypothetical protein
MSAIENMTRMLALDVSADSGETSTVDSLFIAKLARERDLVVALDVLDLHDTINIDQDRHTKKEKKNGPSTRPAP